MRRKITVMIVALVITVTGGIVLTRPASADHTCKDEPGCTLCSSSHSGQWDNCCYICGGDDCSGCDN